MKKLTINSCGDCPFIDSDYNQDKTARIDMCGIAPHVITDLKKIHPNCELDDV